ncbi:cactin [Zea mays]|uniref:cactin n=1 Tax=Zea mays TaxID=4577 RepID=UPI0004DEB0CE|nr:cactin [Zea mays]|eukprot:XP_008659553.1 cactin [Zea mays]
MSPIWCSRQLLYILTPSHSTSNAFYNLAVPEICVFCNKLEDEMHEDEDDKRYSPEPIPQQTDNQFEEEDGSFSPQLMHGNEDEDAIDPEEDKAELVEFYVSIF